MNGMRTSSGYVTTFHAVDGQFGVMRDDDLKKLQSFRDDVAAMSRDAGCKLRVCVKPRLGRNNPNASKYSRVRRQVTDQNGVTSYTRSPQSVLMADAAYFDVYLYRRYPWR